VERWSFSRWINRVRESRDADSPTPYPSDALATWINTGCVSTAGLLLLWAVSKYFAPTEPALALSNAPRFAWWLLDRRRATQLDLAPDGKRVAALMPIENEEPAKHDHEMVFLKSFFDELRRRAPLQK
jgi:hypothetical protein